MMSQMQIPRDINRIGAECAQTCKKPPAAWVSGGGTGFKAAIFDLDGTLVDSYKSWEYAYRKALSAVGHDMTDDEFTELYHMTREESMVIFREVYQAWDNVEKMSYEKYIDKIFADINNEMKNQYAADVIEKPHALEYVKSLRHKGVRVCVATLTQAALSETALERLGFMPYLEFVITSNDVGRSKKFPDIFLQAAKRLGFNPSVSIVFEDCPTAIQTAHNAGFMVCGVADRYRKQHISELASYYNWGIDSFSDAPGYSTVCVP